MTEEMATRGGQEQPDHSKIDSVSFLVFKLINED